MKRAWVLVTYLWREFFRSLTGFLSIVFALVFYLVAILSVTGGIDRDYYALVIGAFFAVFSLALTVVIGDRTFHAKTYLLMYRLPTRAHFLAALVLTAVLISFLFELVIAAASLLRLVTPLSAGMVLDFLPVWISWLVLGAALGLHMCEMVRRGWSRTVVYGLLAFILFAINQQSGMEIGITDRYSWLPHFTPDPARWKWAADVVNVLIWPVSAAIRVARSEPYSALESLSPAMLLLLSAALFWLAMRLFGDKDLLLPEG
jgi:hypothetical protein